MAGIPGSPPDLREVPPGCAFHPCCHFVVGTGNEVLPVLRSVQGEDADQIVACHLYDPRFNVESPSMADLAGKYEALAQESNAQ